MDNQKILAVGTNNYLFYFDIPHRILFKKQEIMLNLDYSNSKENKNSANIISGVDMKNLENKLNGQNGN